ncbi:MAG: sigma-54 dependent transcriptional regulator [Geothermobacteraceae bacterium]
MSRKILVVDDENLICWSLCQALSRLGHIAESAQTGNRALKLLDEFAPDIVILDINLPDISGIEILRRIKQAESDTIVIMMTANGNADSLVEAFQLGADDYFGKPFNLQMVEHVVEQALEKQQLQREVASLKHAHQEEAQPDRMIGNSPRMIELFKLIRISAETDCKTVLILGESGTGKELVARAIHNHSPRKNEPFLELNCAAIPDTLLENELFGHERGAYTDASKMHRGVFETANRGTVFLDEIGDMPMHMQAKILKVIENKTFRRLGGTEELETDVRIIAATNQNLQQLVAEGKFRKDLFFRLNVMTLILPPLRERREDIPALADYFVSRLNRQYGKHYDGVSDAGMRRLTGYHWPGNVRELKNIIERAMMLEEGARLEFDFMRNYPSESGPEQVPAPMNASLPQQPGRSLPSGNRQLSSPILERALSLPPEGIDMEEVEKELIRLALAMHNGNQTRAARYLNISRDTLRYRLKKMESDQGDAGEGPGPFRPSPNGWQADEWTVAAPRGFGGYVL